MKIGAFFKRIGRGIVNLFIFKGSLRPTITIFIFALIVGVFIQALIEQPGYATALVALGTLVLAIATAWSIDEARKREKRHREDELAQERRLRDKDELNEIIEWAVDIAKCEIPAEATAVVSITNRERDRMVASAHMRMLANSFRAMIGKSLYMGKIAYMFGQELQLAVDKLTKDLETHLDLINKCVDAVNNNKLAEFKSTIKELTEHWQQLDRSTDNVIAKACISKMDILNI